MDTLADYFFRGHTIVQNVYHDYIVPFLGWCLYVYGKSYNYVMTLKYPRLVVYNNMTVVEHVVFEDPVYVVRRFVLPKLMKKTIHEEDFKMIKTICFNKSYDATAVFKSIYKLDMIQPSISFCDIYKITDLRDPLMSVQLLLNDNTFVEIDDANMYKNMYSLNLKS